MLHVLDSTPLRHSRTSQCGRAASSRRAAAAARRSASETAARTYQPTNHGRSGSRARTAATSDASAATHRRLPSRETYLSYRFQWRRRPRRGGGKTVCFRIRQLALPLCWVMAGPHVSMAQVVLVATLSAASAKPPPQRGDALWSQRALEPADVEDYLKALERLAHGANRSAPVTHLDAAHFTESCRTVVRGSHTHDFDTFEYNGPTSDREVVFNLGAYKSGSTSFEAAAQMLGLRSCKTGWGEVGAGGEVSFDLGGVAAFAQCPVPGPKGCTPKRVPNVDIFNRAIEQCATVGDAPWIFLAPVLMRAFPKAKFVYTRQKTCHDWVYHVSGLINAGYGGGPLEPCYYGGHDPSPPSEWYDRCVEVERTIVLTAQKFKVPLLVLHSSGEHFNLKMPVVAKFLGRAGHDAAKGDYPHVGTPAKHGPGDKLPPPDAFDQNFDLWSGNWNGGVPEGVFSRAPRSPPSTYAPVTVGPR